MSDFQLKCPNKFVIDRDALFFALAVAAHPRRFVNRDAVDQLIKHEPVQFLKAGVSQLGIDYDTLTKEEFVTLVGILNKSKHVKNHTSRRGKARPPQKRKRKR